MNNDRQEKRRAQQQGAAGDGRARHPVQRVSAQARSRQTLAARHDSPTSYGRYTVDAAFDVFDGEPIEAFKTVNVMDANHQRKLELEFKREVFARMIETRPAQRQVSA